MISIIIHIVWASYISSFINKISITHLINIIAWKHSRSSRELRQSWFSQISKQTSLEDSNLNWIGMNIRNLRWKYSNWLRDFGFICSRPCLLIKIYDHFIGFLDYLWLSTEKWDHEISIWTLIVRSKSWMNGSQRHILLAS
jgi:hypothetical protein